MRSWSRRARATSRAMRTWSYSWVEMTPAARSGSARVSSPLALARLASASRSRASISSRRTRASTWFSATRSPRSARVAATCPSTSLATSACALAASVPTTETVRSTARTATFATVTVIASGLAAPPAGSAAEPAGGAAKPEAITVTVANVAVRAVERTVSVVGTLAANAQAEVASEVEGQVAATLADLGDRVAENHVLARVRRDEIEARLREAEASLAKASGDETRAEPLRAAGVISTQEYDQVRMALDVARARRDQLRIQLEHTDIRAPMDGSVAARLIDAGSYVKAGTVLFRIVQDDPLKFRGEIPERDVPALRPGQGVRVSVDAFPGEIFTGQVSRIGSAADPAARSLAFEALVPNADHRIRPGFFGHGEVVVSHDERALAVPRAALTSYAGVTKLFLIEGGVAREREVKLGVDLGDGWVEIAEGMSQGKQVATSGLSKLADGTQVVVRTDVPPGA